MRRARLLAVSGAAALAVTLAGCFGIGLPRIRGADAPTGKPGTYTVVDGERFDVPTGGSVPARFSIWHDDFEAEYAGRTGDGRQFFVGDDASDDFRRGYLVLFVWTSSGEFESAKVADLGTKATEATRAAVRTRFPKSLGHYRIANIRVEPFGVKAYGDEVGFVPVTFDGVVAVELLPLNNMAFTAPWTYGHYDT